ncbi:hypothetical protein [Paraburkholderia phytofirmans]|uniref:Uncharacterized protein n=1 Tax=Paraburkholderia phytofirmans (strain DSM 17436 / LMG 22146 / PsJN) TaxID=398527 RepID=B2THB3_PARPJ|nr:hypothetical protein [Paraburkholderia phytofirmans]ACD21659.1 hypothetical protein Bphyt_7374 [Paraburkholderia phytofirmans PsJN]
MTENTIFQQLADTGLFGEAKQTPDGLVGFERTPLLLSRAEETYALAGRAAWLDQPAGWYATTVSDIPALFAWLPKLLAPRFCLASSDDQCWQCRRPTRVFALCLPADYLFLGIDVDSDDDEEEDDYSVSGEADFANVPLIGWHAGESGTFVGNLGRTNSGVRRFLEAHCPNYRPDTSKTLRGHYYMNHCDHCGAKLGDYFLHQRPRGAFFPTSEDEAMRITLQPANELLIAQGEYFFRDPDYIPYSHVLPVGDPAG